MTIYTATFTDSTTYKDLGQDFVAEVEIGFDSIGDLISDRKQAPYVLAYLENIFQGYTVVGDGGGGGEFVEGSIDTLLSNPRSFSFSPTGSSVVIAQNTLSSEFSLSTPFDVTTIDTTPVNTFFQFDETSNNTEAVRWGNSGNTLYYLDRLSVNQLGFSSAYSLSTFSGWDGFLSYFGAVGGTDPEQNWRGLAVSPTGDKLWQCGLDTQVIREFKTTIPYDFSNSSMAASLSRDSFSTGLPSPVNMYIPAAGTSLYMVYSLGGARVDKYTLSSAWDITTLSLVGSFDISGTSTSPQDVAVSEDESVLYILDSSGFLYQIANGDYV